MKKGNKIKLIVIFVIIMLLGLFMLSVTALTISQYRQGCHDWDASQDGEYTYSDTSQGCREKQSRICCNSYPLKGCCEAKLLI